MSRESDEQRTRERVFHWKTSFSFIFCLLFVLPSLSCIIFSVHKRTRHAAQPLRRDVYARRPARAHGRRRRRRRRRQEGNDGALGRIDSAEAGAPTSERRRHAPLADLLQGRAHLVRRHRRRLGRRSRALGRRDGPDYWLHAEEEAPERRRQAQARRERGRGIGRRREARPRAWRRRRTRRHSRRRAESSSQLPAAAAAAPRKLPPPPSAPRQAPAQDVHCQRRVGSQHPATLPQGQRRGLLLLHELLPLDARGRRDGGRRPAGEPGPAQAPLAAEGRVAVVAGRDPVV